jgi:uncharacterized protein
MRNRNFVLAICALTAVSAGCSAARSNFYALSRSAEAAPPGKRVSVAVGPVSIPAVVDRPQIVVRIGPNEVFLDEFHRWAAPLTDDIARVVAEDLATILGSTDVALFPRPAGARYRVLVEVMSFDSVPGEAAALDAVWTVRAPQAGASRSGRTTTREPARESGYAGVVAAHSRALGTLSAEIAGAIRQMERE